MITRKSQHENYTLYEKTNCTRLFGITSYVYIPSLKVQNSSVSEPSAFKKVSSMGYNLINPSPSPSPSPYFSRYRIAAAVVYRFCKTVAFIRVIKLKCKFGCVCVCVILEVGSIYVIFRLYMEYYNIRIEQGIKHA